MKYLYLFLCLISVSCSKDATVSPQKVDSLFEANLFLRHGSLSASEFEQYKFQKNSIFFECGEVQGEKKIIVGDSLSEISGADTSRLNFLLNQVSITSAKLSKNTSMYSRDPGIIQLTVIDSMKSREITISLDSITHSQDGLELVLREISERIRGLNRNDICGNKSFFGLGKIPPDF